MQFGMLESLSFLFTSVLVAAPSILPSWSDFGCSPCLASLSFGVLADRSSATCSTTRPLRSPASWQSLQSCVFALSFIGFGCRSHPWDCACSSPSRCWKSILPGHDLLWFWRTIAISPLGSWRCCFERVHWFLFAASWHRYRHSYWSKKFSPCHFESAAATELYPD